MLFAPNISSSDFGTSSTFTVADGESIIVYGINLGNLNLTSIQTITFTIKNGSTTIGAWTLLGGLAGDSHASIDINFVADQGLSIVASGTTIGNGRVSVLHSAGGA